MTLLQGTTYLDSARSFGHEQLGISLGFPPFDVRGGILVSAKAAHVGSTDRNRYCPLFPDFPPWTPQSAAHPSGAMLFV
jgi:hypothetical protein